MSPTKINKLSKHITYLVFKAVEEIFQNHIVLINTDEVGPLSLSADS